MKKGLLLFGFMMAAGLIFSLTFVPLVVAQPEEEEEPIQARPNPMEHTMQGQGRMMIKGNMKANMMQERGMQKEKAMGAKEVMGPVSNMRQGNQSVSTNGHKHDSDETEDLAPVPEEVQDVVGTKAAMGLESRGEDTPANPVNPVTSGAVKAFGWGEGDDAPGNPVNPVGWDPTDRDGDIGDQFGGQMPIGAEF